MKILFTSNCFYPSIGGIEVNSELLAYYFYSRGHEVRLITQSADSSYTLYPYDVIRRPSFWELIRNYIWADVVYQNNIEIRSLWPSLFWPVPLVISIRTWIRGSSGRRRVIDRAKMLFLNRANSVIAISDAIRRDTFPSAVVIGNPYRSNLFRLMPEIPRRNSVAFLGRLVPEKGATLLIQAFQRLKTESEPLTIIGEGPEKSILLSLASQLGVDVRLTGNLEGEQLVRELNSHSILVVPSIWDEPFGNVVLEGMACGCTVLAADCGGLPDAVGAAGLLFRRADVVDLALKLNMLLTDPDLITRLRLATPDNLESHRQDVVAQQYLNVISEATHKHL